MYLLGEANHFIQIHEQIKKHSSKPFIWGGEFLFHIYLFVNFKYEGFASPPCRPR